MSDINKVYFSSKSVENGDLEKLLRVLMEYSYSDNNDRDLQLYNDIHIYPADCGAFILEWVQLPWSKDYGGSFQYVDEDQVVMRDYILPDGTGIFLNNDEEYKEFLEDWLKDNPGWHRHPTMNAWVNDEKIEKLDDEFELRPEGTI